MANICQACGSEVPAHHLFCGICGTQLESPVERPRPAKPDEVTRSSRRMVTILFADLANFTQAAEKIDPEKVFLTIRNILEKLSAPVKHYGGNIDRYVGDGFLATFGVPEAHEDDTLRALMAALEMQEMMGELGEETRQMIGWEVKLRVGINAGQVISGRLSTGTLLDWSVFGHHVNLTNRLQTAARPGTVLVSEGVYRLTRSKYEFLEAIELKLKGFDKPVIGYELVKARDVPQFGRGLSGRPTSLVGRTAEYDLLVMGLQRTRLERRGGIFLVSGEAGIGKSRLVEEVVNPMEGQYTIIRAQCSPHDMLSYRLITQILESLVGITPDDTSEVRQDRLEENLSVSGLLFSDAGPVFRELILRSPLGANIQRDPQQYQRQIHAALRRLFTWLGRRGATLLVLDDLQWADASSLEALGQVIDLIQEIPLAVIAISRDAGVENLPEYLRKPAQDYPRGLIDVPLQPLQPEESDTLMSMLLSEVTLPPALLQSVYERTQGNPFLVEEVTRMLLDGGIVQETDAGWQLDRGWNASIQAVPETINGLILNRYDHQPPALKKLLDVIAVLGASFQYSVLAAMDATSGMDLREDLMALEERDFIRCSAFAGTLVYSFRHALMQEVIYETILFKDRQVLHRDVAKAIQMDQSDTLGDEAARIGYHLEHGGSPEASKYLIQAAAQAAERYANQEAIDYYRRASAVISHYENDSSKSVDINLGLAELLTRIGNPDMALEELKQALKIARDSPESYRFGDIRYQLGRTYMDQGNLAKAVKNFNHASSCLMRSAENCQLFQRTDLEREIGWLMSDQGKLDEAREHAQAALELAFEDEDLVTTGSAYSLLSAVHYWEGDLSESLKNAQEALVIREQSGDIWGAASSQTTLGHLYHRLGEWPQAESILRQAIYVQREIGDFQRLAGTLTNLGLLMLDWGRLDEAFELMNEAVLTLPLQELPPALVSTLFLNRGVVWVRLSDPEKATYDFDRAYESGVQARNNDLSRLALAYMGEANLVAERVDRAWEYLQKAEDQWTETVPPAIEAEILRIRSKAFKRNRDWTKALSCNLKAQELYQQTDNSYEIARRKIEAVDILLAQECDWESTNLDPRREVETALETFRKLNVLPDITQAEILASKIAADTRAGGQDGSEPGSYPTMIVYLHLDIPLFEGSGEAEQERVADAFTQTSMELRKVAESRNALVTAMDSGLAYVLMGSPETASQRLGLLAIETALAAIDTCIRMNRNTQRQRDVQIPGRVGIVAGYSSEPIESAEQTALFASITQVRRRLRTVVEEIPDYQILLSEQVAKDIQEVYELEHYVPSAEGGGEDTFYLLGYARSDAVIPPGLPKSSAKLIGRVQEMNLLSAWIDRSLTDGIGQVSYIEAEAGMGKTRLLNEILESGQPGFMTLLGKCESFHANISYWPLIEMLANDEIPDSNKTQRLKGLLGLQPPSVSDQKLLQNLSPEALRRELYGSVRDFVLEKCQDKPVLMVVEDIHWLDLSSLDLLDFLIPLTMETRFSILLLARAEMPGPHRALVAKARRVTPERYLEIRFSSLGDGESTDLVRALLGVDRLPERVASLLEPFSGHPLSIEEALRYLVERGWLVQQDGKWRLRTTGALAHQRMPDNYKDLLLGRLDVLNPETLHVLQTAAVLGETFDRSVLRRVIPGAGLVKRLSELVGRGWLFSAHLGKPSIFNFRHTLTRETIYATLMRSKVQLLHQRAGEAIEALYRESLDENVELLAYHFGNSGLKEKSFQYLLRAAEKSASRQSLSENLTYYQKIKDAIESKSVSKPGYIPRIWLGLASIYLSMGEPGLAMEEITSLLAREDIRLAGDVQAEAYMRLGEARNMQGELENALGDYQIALLKYEIWQDTHAHLTKSILSAREWIKFGIRQGVAQTLFDMRDNRRAREEIDRILLEIDKEQLPEQAAEAINLEAGVAYRENDIGKSSQLLKECLVIYQSYGNRDKMAAIYSNLGVLAMAANELDESKNYMTMGLEINRALGDFVGVAITQNNLGQLEAKRQRYYEASKYLESAVQTSRRAELNQLLGQGLANLGGVYTALGRTSDARNVLEEAEATCKSFGYQDLLSEVGWKQAECYLELGELAQAKEAGEAALSLAMDVNSRDLQSEARRVLSRVYRGMGNSEKALEQASHAWKARVTDPDPLMRARFSAEYALALAANENMDEARRIVGDYITGIEGVEVRQISAELGILDLKTD